MLSFQILDGGEVMTFALEARTVVIGSATDCDIRLASPGVEPHHARIEPIRREGAMAYKLIDLSNAGATRVNGEAVAQVALSVGDRIEIAGATLVLGKRVMRRATPQEVLDDGLKARLRPPRAKPAPKAKQPWIPYAIIGGILLSAGVAWFAVRDRPPDSLRVVSDLLAQGDHVEADRVLGHVRAAWAGTNARRLSVVEDYAREVTRMRKRIAALEKEVVDSAATRTVGDQLAALRKLESAARDDIERAAVRQIIGRMRDLRQSAPAAPRAEPDKVDAPAQPSGAAAASPPPPRTVAQPGDRPVAPLPAAGAQRAQQALERGDLRAAAAAIEGLGAASVADAAELRAQIDTKVEAVRRDGLAQAEGLMALGRGDEASALLRQLASMLPEAPAAELRRHAQSFAASVPPPRPVAPKGIADPLGDLLRLVESGEASFAEGDFERARQSFAEAADKVKVRDDTFAAELRMRSEDCRHLQKLQVAVAQSLRTSAKPEVHLANDQRARLIDCEAGRLRLVADSGEILLTWADLPAAAVDTVLRAVDPPAEAFLGAAALALSAGDESVAEQRLLTAIKKDARAKSAADELLARARGERIPASGYRIEGGRFARPELSPIVKELDGKLGAALRGDTKGREAVLSDVLGRGPEQLDAVVQVLRQHQRTLADRLHKHPFRKNHQRLAAERTKLDAARAHAMALIFDEERYFYPYAPPAVSSDKAKQYHAVQREVDARVEAVRAIWEGCSLQFSIPDNIAADVERLRWVTGVLDGLGEASPGVAARTRWVLSLPDQRTLDIKTFCQNPEEVERARLAARIAKLNSKRTTSLTSAEREELQLTNAYRMMMGLMPLVVDLRVLAAARKHCEEMERLGYFGHMSPVAENRTPYDRMQLAGYAHGGSENIAANDSAAGAHGAWLHSSGHHRNILGEAHTEFACGQRGRLWTQNFGAGRDFERDLPE